MLRSTMPGTFPFGTLVLALLAAAPSLPGGRTLLAQGPEELRVGVSFGGMSIVGLLMEYRWGDRSVDVNIGTWSFRDLSVSLVAKQYYGPGDFRPYSGLGLAAVIAPFHGSGERIGVALLARAPMGVEWNLDANHHLGMDLSLNRALWIRRKDPRDETPPNSRIIPLPEFHYRWKR